MEILNMVAKKRYAHEWRESWEKVDFIREAMKKYPNAEWYVYSVINIFLLWLANMRIGFGGWI